MTKKQEEVDKVNLIEADKVYVTPRYSLFKGVLGNRIINNHHVTNLSRSIAKHDMLSIRPIVVTKEMKVIDGQHRLAAAKNNDVPVYFMIAREDLSLEDIHLLNQDQRSWLGIDYVKSYIDLGAKAYKDFYQFMQDYELSVEGALNFYYGHSGGYEYRQLKAGELEITPEMEVVARKRGDLWLDMAVYFPEGSKGYRYVHFYRAIIAIDELGYTDRLRDKLKASGTMLETKFNVRDHMRQFEDILNWKNKSGETVRVF